MKTLSRWIVNLAQKDYLNLDIHMILKDLQAEDQPRRSTWTSREIESSGQLWQTFLWIGCILVKSDESLVNIVWSLYPIYINFTSEINPVDVSSIDIKMAISKILLDIHFQVLNSTYSVNLFIINWTKFGALCTVLERTQGCYPLFGLSCKNSLSLSIGRAPGQF